VLDDEGEVAKPKPLAKRYTDGMKAILNAVAADSTVSESAILFEKDEQDKNEQRRKHLKALRMGKDVIKHAETSEHYDKLYEIPVRTECVLPAFSSSYLRLAKCKRPSVDESPPTVQPRLVVGTFSEASL
jgi:hypothetical protein